MSSTDKPHELQAAALEWMANYIRNEVTYILFKHQIIYYELLTVGRIVELYLEYNP